MRLAVTGSLNTAAFNSLLQQCQPCIAGNDKELTLDLSSAEWGSPSGMVPFAGLLRALSKQGVNVHVDSYPDSSVCSYFCRMHFYKRIGAKSPCGTGEVSSGDRFIEITELKHAEINAAVALKLSKLLQRLPKSIEATDVSRSSFIDACGELVSNTRHAYNHEVDATVAERPPALLQAQFYSKQELVEVCICDCGMGIKKSMEGIHQDNFVSDLDAINAALALRNKAPVGGGAGLGLAALQSFTNRNGGFLSIRSGDALKIQRGRKGMASTQQLANWNGTIVTLGLYVEKSADLSTISRRLGK